MDHPLHIAIVGRQGSGKGTQARLLAERLDLTHLATGDLLRAAAAGRSEMADAVRGYLEAGALVPDGMVDGVVGRALQDAVGGSVLDGYPRTLAQVAVLDRLVDLDLVVELDLAPSLAVARLAARRMCTGCGMTATAPAHGDTQTCATCGGPMVRRHDDHPTAVQRRLDTYDRATAPLLQRYESRGLLARVDAGRPVPEIHAEILVLVAGARARQVTAELASAG